MLCEVCNLLMCPYLREPGEMQRCRDVRVRGCKDAGMQGCKDAGM